MLISILPFQYVRAFTDLSSSHIFLSSKHVNHANLAHEMAHIFSNDPDHGDAFSAVAAEMNIDVPKLDILKQVRNLLGIPSYIAANIGNICVAESSKVWTKTGPRPIADINIGDEIYTFNYRTNITQLTTVQAKVVNGVADCVEVISRSGHRAVTTPNHRFLTTNGFREAQLLQINDQIVETGDTPDMTNDYLGIIKSIKRTKQETVYDLCVPPHYNFIIDGVIVHNSGVQNLLLDHFLLAAYRKHSARQLATEGHWEVINEGTSTVEGDSLSAKDQLIRLYPTPKGAFPVTVLYIPTVTHFRSPQARQVVYDFMVAEAMMALGMARRKIAGMPSPDGGSIQMDGADLVTMGTEQREKCLERAIQLGEPLGIWLW